MLGEAAPLPNFAYGLLCTICRLSQAAPPMASRVASAERGNCGEGESRGRRGAEAQAIVGNKRCRSFFRVVA